MKDQDGPGEYGMALATALAMSANPHPNPRVGCILFDADGEVVGEGFHEAAGGPHAERVALSSATAPVHTAVVSLEPCSHTGRTPPCTEALIEAGVKRVVIGSVDPDERVSGSGIEALEAAGIEVKVIGPDIADIDPGYAHHRRTGRPRVLLKLAATLDGQTATTTGESKWITGTESREAAHRLRAQADAVVVGVGTALADDPQLDVRIDGFEGRQPRPVVICGRRGLKADIAMKDPLVYTPDPGEKEVDLGRALADMAERGYLDVMVEGGATLAASFWREGLVDDVVVFLAGKMAGGSGRPMLAGVFDDLDSARPLRINSASLVGDDLMVKAQVQ